MSDIKKYDSLPKKNSINQNTVYQANRLVEASYHMTTAEKRLICLLISFIKKEDEDFCPYLISVKYLAKIAEIKGNYIYEQVRDLTEKIMKRVITLPHKKGLLQIAFISHALYNEEEGTIELTFDPLLKPYLLELKQEFTRYFLKYIFPLKSFYSIRFYELLKSYQRLEEKRFSVEWLKRTFSISKDQYKLYSNFKKRVILQAQKDLAKYTDISFSFQEVKKGRKVEDIIFYIFENELEFPMEIDEEDWATGQPVQSLAGKLRRELHEYGFTGDLKEFLKKDGFELTNASFKVAKEEIKRASSQGKPIRNRGGFIFRKLKEKAGLVVLEQEKEREEQEKQQRLEEERKAQQKELLDTFEREREERIQHIFEELQNDPEKLQESLAGFKETEVSQMPFLRKRFEEQGLEDSAVKMMFFAYLSKNFLSEEESDFCKYADLKGHRVQFINGEYVFEDEA